MSEGYDVAIVGAGDVGAAIARALSPFDLRVVLIDSGDVGAGTSKANTAILHTGFDAKPGTQEARLVARGHDLMLEYAEQVGIPIERTGALLIAWTPEELDRFPAIVENARACRYDRVARIGLDELYRREPHLAAGALGALEVPDEFIVCPWTPPLACATQAVLGGVELRRFEEVSGIARTDRGAWVLRTGGGDLSASWLVNAAGLRSDEIHRMTGAGGFTVTPRKGELIVFDKLSRPLVNHVLLPVPTEKTKGVLIAPTVFGNVLLGPTADDIRDKLDTSSTPAGLRRLRELGARLMPDLLAQEVTAVFAGLRAATEHPDYQLGFDLERRYLWAGGIRSTGLTASLAIAEWARESLEEAGLELRGDGAMAPVRMPNIGEAGVRPYEDPEAVAADPEYGRIVCFCERVTSGEVRDALRGPIPAADADGLRRRTRALTGRCQGFFCAARIRSQIVADLAPGPAEGASR